MKFTKKLLTAFVAMFMVLSMGTSLQVNAEGSPHTITIEGQINDGDQFAAYQIFSGDYVLEKNDNGVEYGILSNIQWGSAVDEDNLSEIYSKLAEITIDGTNPFAGVGSAQDVADVLSNPDADENEFDTELAIKFADVIGKYLDEKKTSGTVSGNQITGLDDGYYLVKNTSVEEWSAYTRYLLTVVGDETIKAKAGVPEVEKKVQDTNDSKDPTTEANPDDYEKDDYGRDEQIWKDSADYDIGDRVPFKLTGTLPSNIEDYDSYHYEFVDTLSDGFDQESYDLSAVYIERENGERIDLTISSTYSKYNDDGIEEMHFVFDDLKSKISDLKPTDKVVIEYSVILNAKAVIGMPGNPNEVKLIYSNNPNSGGDGDYGETPPDKVVVFTYEYVVNKVDENMNPLQDAKFAIYKLDPAKGGYVDPVLKEIFGDSQKEEYYMNYVEVSPLDQSLFYVDKDGTTFGFKGLDDGEYMLVETEVPSGYNRFAPLKFTIDAKHEDKADDPKLISLTCVEESGTIEGDVETGIINRTVINRKGAVLPSTGGVGTTLFYIFGGVLVVCAGVLLVVKRRMNA